MSPKRIESTAVVQLALGKGGLDVLKRRVASNTKPGELGWTAGILGASAVYNAGEEGQNRLQL